MVKPFLLFVGAAVLLGGCDCGRKPGGGGAVPPGKRVRMSKHDKVRKPQQRRFLSASHIVIPFKGQPEPDPSAKLDRAAAERLARDVASRLKTNPAIFAEMARKHSGATDASRGGYLGAWPRGRMPKNLEDVIDQLEIGQVSAAIETPKGFEILRREIAVLSGSQILISFRGALGAPRTVTRNKLEAMSLANELFEELKRTPIKYNELARKHSDDRIFGPRGGRMGLWVRGRNPVVLEQAIDRLEIGAISPPLDTPSGFLILRRDDPYPNN